MKKILLLLSYLLGSGLALNAQVEEEHKPTGAEAGLMKFLKEQDYLHIMFDSRFDYRVNIDENQTNFNGFESNTMKLVFHGEIVEGFRYRIRHRLNKSHSVLRDNSSTSTDLAYFELDAGDKWTFRIGKQFLAFGTFEFDYNPADLYMYTIVNNDIDAYKTGLNVIYKAGKQNFNFQVVDSDAPQFAAERYKNKALTGAFMWDGNLFDGAWKTKYGYAAMQHDGSKYFSWITIGNQFNIGKFTTELDWYYGDRVIDMNSDLGTGLDNPNYRQVRDNSVSANFILNLGKVRPIIRGTWNKREDKLTDGSYDELAIQGAVEYFPFANPLLKDLRFHAAYWYSNRSYDDAYKAMSDYDNHTFLLGMRWYFRIM